MTIYLADRLRERLTLRYMGNCKCGHCQLVPDVLLQEAIAALSASPASLPVQGVQVKELQWRELTSPREDGHGEPNGDWEAQTPFGFYEIEMVEGPGIVVWGLTFGIEEEYIGGDHASPDAAKVAAQSDYETRILGALEHMTDREITDDVLREILAGCEGATPGPWSQVGRTGGTICYGHPKKGGWVASMHWRGASVNGAHVARLDPQTVSAIVTELLSLRARRTE